MALHLKKTVIGTALLALLAAGAGMAVSGCQRAESQALAPASAAATAQAAASAPAPAPVKPVPRHKQRTSEEAASALLALPELKAWSVQLEKNSGGKTHGAVMQYDPELITLHGKHYYQFSFVEDDAEHALRREDFLVSVSDDEILVEDFITGEHLTLERWRKEKQPLKPSGIDG